MFKKGQTEDIFADALPAGIILVITLIVAWGVGASHQGQIDLRIHSSESLVYTAQFVQALRMPVDMVEERDYAGGLLFDPNIVPEAYRKQIRTVADSIKFAPKIGQPGFEWLNPAFFNKPWADSDVWECAWKTPFETKLEAWAISIIKDEKEAAACFSVTIPERSVMSGTYLKKQQKPQSRIYLPTEDPQKPLKIDVWWYDI